MSAQSAHSAQPAHNEAEMRTLLSARVDTKRYCEIDPLKALFFIAFQWSVIAAALTAAIWSGDPAVFALAMLVIASRQHALGIIMHDATHYRLFANRTVNDTVSDLFCAFPVLMTTNRYRYYHLLHHRRSNTSEDPYWSFFQGLKDWQWPKTLGQAAGVFLRDLFGLTAHNEMKMILRWGVFVNHFSTRDEPPPLGLRERLSFYGFAGALVAGLWVFDGWLYFLGLWYIPMIFINMPFIRLRTVAEHIAIPGRSVDGGTRHVDGTWLERVLISPCNINYHVAHHLFSGVPLYNLPAFHERLLQEPEYRDYMWRKESYLSLDPRKGVLGEVLVQRA